MHPSTGDIWYAKSGGNVRNYHSKRKAPNTRHIWIDKTTRKGPQKKKSVAQNIPQVPYGPRNEKTRPIL